MITKETVLNVVAIGSHLAIIGIFAICIVRRIRHAKREKARLRENVASAIAKITADGRIEGPKGPYKPFNWCRKWVAYANGLPAPRRHYEMSGREHPNYLRHNDE